MNTKFGLGTVTALFLLVCLQAPGAVFTWDGGGGDSNWLTPANWNPDGAPAADGTSSLIFAGNARTAAANNFTADTLFTGITFANNNTTGKTAGFTLSGNRITLGGNVVTTLPEVTGTLTATISHNMLLNNTRTFDIAGANNPTRFHNLTVNGVIGEVGETAGLIKSGGGRLNLNGANSYSGKTVISSGEVYANTLSNIGGGTSSLGAPTTAANGTIDMNASLFYSGGSTSTDRPINLTGGNAQIRQVGTENSNLTLNGNITGANFNLMVRGSRTVTVNGQIATGSGAVSRTDNGTLILTHAGNTFSGSVNIYDGITSANSISDTGSPSALGQGGNITFGQNTVLTTGRLRFTGAAGGSSNRPLWLIAPEGNTEHGGIIENTVAGQTLALSGNVGVSTAGRTPRLQLTGNGNGVLSGTISGGLSLQKFGSGAWTLSGTNSYTGPTTVSNGPLLINGSTAAGSAVTVAADGRLGGSGTVNGTVSVASGGQLAPGSGEIGTLTLADSGATALTLNASRVMIDMGSAEGLCDQIAVAGTLVLNGANVITLAFPDGTAPAGSYTQLTYTARSGEGTLTLDRVYPNATLDVDETATVLIISGSGTTDGLIWQGDDTANTWDTATANWNLGVYADNMAVRFDDSGSDTPAVNISPVAVTPHSVTVDTSARSYTLGGAGITGNSGLTKSGTTALTLSGACSYTGATLLNAGSLALSGSLDGSSITVANGTTFTQSASGAIRGAGAAFTCRGTATLAGANTYGGITMIGVGGTANITLTATHAQALGSTNAGTTVIGGTSTTENRLILGAAGITITDETLTLSGTPGRTGMHYTPGSDSGTWDGNIVLDGGLCYLNASSPNGTLVIGASSDNFITGTAANINMRGNGTLSVNSRLAIGSTTLQRDDSGTCVINSTGNVWGATAVVQGTLRLGISEALPATTTLTLGKNAAINNQAAFDLNGNTQTISGLIEQHTMGAGGLQRIVSAVPATLTVSNSTARTFGTEGSVIEGAVTLIKANSGTLTLTGQNTTTGDFVVRGGTLTVSATGSLGSSSTNIVVEAGTLALQNSTAVSDQATVRIAGGGAKLDLAAGVNETVDRLVLGGTEKRPATYGATGSGAAYQNDIYFSGEGILTVLRGYEGTLILLR